MDQAFVAVFRAAQVPLERLELLLDAQGGTFLELEAVLQAVGRRGLAKLVRRLPSVLEGVTDAEAFLRTVNTIIHPEVHKLYPDATPPEFSFSPSADGMIVTYRSARRLDALAAGLIEGCGDLFGQPVELTRIDASGTGNDSRWHVRFGPPGDDGSGPT